MHGMEPHEEIDYWRERARKAEEERDVFIALRQSDQFDRALVVEVCHELIDRAMRNDGYEGGMAYALDYRNKEAAVRALLADRDAALSQLATITAERDRLREAAERARRHPMAPERCPMCEWTNVNLMNYGSHDGASRWMCHGCAALAVADRDRMKPVFEAAVAWRDDVCGPRACILLDAIDAFRRALEGK